MFELYARPAKASQLKTQYDNDAFESCFERYFNLPKTNKMLKTILILFLEELICTQTSVYYQSHPVYASG